MAAAKLRWRLSSSGGDDRTRTDDPLLAKQVLYQLSYVPAPLEEHWKRGEGLHLALASRGYRVYRGLGRARTIWTLLARLGSAAGDIAVVSWRERWRFVPQGAR